MNNVQTSFPLVDEILHAHSRDLGKDLPGYRNHVCRVLNYFSALSRPSGGIPDSVLIAAAFHDIGIWTDKTFDYLEPSIDRSSAYLATCQCQHLAPEIGAVISQHHKIRPYRSEFAPNVEAFRRADLVDVSIGAVRFGLPGEFVRAVKTEFPDAGFHWKLVTLTARQFLRTPLNPLPVLRW